MMVGQYERTQITEWPHETVFFYTSDVYGTAGGMRNKRRVGVCSKRVRVTLPDK
jgi:hypothetical protein